MLNRKFRLMVQVIGLIAMLAVTLAVPGVTQQAGFSRASMLQNVHSMLATLTASTELPLDTDSTIVYSDQFLTLAFIPISPAVQQDVGENGIDLGALAVGEDLPKVLPRGIYNLRLVKDKLWFIDRGSGTHVLELPAKTTIRPMPPLPQVSISTFSIEYTKIESKQAVTNSLSPVRFTICATIHTVIFIGFGFVDAVVVFCFDSGGGGN